MVSSAPALEAWDVAFEAAMLPRCIRGRLSFFFFQAEDGIRDSSVTGVQTCALPISSRADHILRTVASKVRFNRAIINPKWDSYYNFSNLHRLHLLYGEANQSEPVEIGRASCRERV